MDVQDAGRIFEGLLENCPNLRGFHPTGGEPFLDFERLLRIQRLATEFGIPIEYVETNAGWCVNEAVTRERFESLKDAGLGRVLVSCSPFHAESIPLERVVRAVEAAHDVFGPDGVILWSPEFFEQLSIIATDRTISLGEYVESVGQSVARYTVRSGYSLITGGRIGYQLADLYEKRPPKQCEGDQCRPELLDSGHAHFDPYGNLIPSFCSGISLGDARSMAELYYYFDLTRLPLVNMLVEGGPYELYRFAVREFGYVALEGGYIGKCHLCVDLRRWIISLTDKYTELAPAEFYERITDSREADRG
jgi:hypothetical protein